MQTFLEHELLPGWNSLYERVKAFVEERWIRNLPSALVSRIRDDLAGDYQRLFRVRPDLEALWGWDSATAIRSSAGFG